jgi:hypothetical protein
VLERGDVTELLGATDAFDLNTQRSFLSTLARFPLSDDAWRALGEPVHELLADPTPDPDFDVTLGIAARSPLRSVRTTLLGIARDGANPFSAVARRLIGEVNLEDVGALLGRLASENPDPSAAEELATRPIERLEFDRAPLYVLVESEAPNVALWSALALARTGEFAALDTILDGRSTNTDLFDGDPAVAEARLCAMLPIPDAFREHVLERLADGDGSPIVAALTRGPEPQRAENTVVSSPSRVGLAGKGNEGLRVEVLEVITAVPELAVDDVGAELLRSLNSQEAGCVVMGAIEHVVCGLDVGTLDGLNLVAGNNLVRLAELLPDGLELPVHDLLRLNQDGVGEMIPGPQIAFLLSRADDSAVLQGFVTELGVTDLDSVSALTELVGAAGDFSGSSYGPRFGGAPGVGSPSIPTAYIDDLAAALPAMVGTDPPSSQEEPSDSWDLLRGDSRMSLPRGDAARSGGVGGLVRRVLGFPRKFKLAVPRPGNSTDPADGAIEDQNVWAENSTGGDHTSSRPPSTAWPRIDAPDAVRVGEGFDVEIGLRGDRDPRVAGTGEFPIPAEDFDLGVEILLDRAGLAIEGDRVFVLPVTAHDRYPSRTVRFTAVDDRNAGDSRRIGVVFRIGKEMRGYAGRDIAVTSADELRAPGSLQTGDSHRVDVSLFTDPDAPDLTVVVQNGDVRNRLVWSVASPHFDVELPDDPSCEGVDGADDAKQFLVETIREASSATSALDIVTSLTGKGRSIARLIPEFVADAVGKAIAQTVPSAPSVLWLSEDPYIPWELAVIDAVASETGPNESPFLGAHVAIGRWLLEARPPPPPLPAQALVVEHEALIKADYADTSYRRLDQAEDEVAQLASMWGPTAQVIAPTLEAVMACLRGTPPAELVHFAIHGEFAAQSASQGLVLIGTDADNKKTTVFLKPSHVEAIRRADGPFVFLNACQMAADREQLGTSAGMVSAFIRSGARAVVAPLWSVSDDVAHETALQFYEAVLTRGGAPAEVLRVRRSSSATLDGTSGAAGPSTVLAYLFFGHPKLRVSKGLTRGARDA